MAMRHSKMHDAIVLAAYQRTCDATAMGKSPAERAVRMTVD